MLLTLKVNDFSRVGVFSTEQESPIHRKLYDQMNIIVN